MNGRGEPNSSDRLLALSALAAAMLLVRALRDRGGSLKVASLFLRRAAPTPRGRPHRTDDSRLYAHRRRRLGAHLTRLADGRRAVLALPLDGSRHTTVYAVDESRPWDDFEHQARLVGAAWGPLRSVSAGL